ncbi:nucleotidyltransferase family protein [Vallitalea guaymasensis]|uniref:Nucleotidyltransferase family protein n=1 Tax=Vallitalea guaymasensis TaxID=1185412 RepID=A0A8J8MB78_9FIRM|nr:nucleotidyltransferase family protein [Vallitalea guaymasensis]QUH29759.1 nucleotidyltransferase family protein [Vallitalea guaymasensis]
MLLKIKQDKEYKLKLHILQHVEFVVKLFQANNIQFFIIKGIALDKIIYNGISMRESRDIDIVVRRESMSDAIDLLLNNDYIFTTDRNGNSKSVSVGFSDIVQHEITFLNQDKTIEVELKQLLNGIFDKSFIEDCFKNIKVNEINNVLIPTLNVDYTFLVLIAYVYKDSEDIFVLNQTKLLPSGDLGLCAEANRTSDLIFGNLFHDDIVDVWKNSDTLKEIRTLIPDKLEGVCGNCLVKNICKGSCRTIALSSFGSINSANPICQKLYDENKFHLAPKCR